LWDSVKFPFDSGVSHIQLDRIRIMKNGVCYIVGSALGSDSKQHMEILRTVDTGQSWQRLPIDSVGRLFDISFPVPDTGFACGYTLRDSEIEACLITTTDGGLTWQHQYPDVIGSFFYRGFFRNALSAIAIISNEPSTRAHRSMDGGKTWQEIEFKNVGSVNFHYNLINSSDRNWIIGVEQRILLSADDGNTWSVVDSRATGVNFGFLNPILDIVFLVNIKTQELFVRPQMAV
jgi:photosystem II stability/assembly factor-like uncharacterized protein